MKNKKMIGAFVFLVLITASVLALAGCVTVSEETIEGTLHNTTDERCYINVYRENGALEDKENIHINSTKIYTLPVPHVFRIKAYDSNDNFIAETELTLRSTDTSFTIIIYSDDISASSS